MTMRFNRPFPVLGLPGLLLISSLILAGCANTQTRVDPLPSHQVVALSSDNIVHVMRRAGFSDEQILEFGTDVRNGLASSGAAQVRVGDKVEAIFAVEGQYLHGTSRLRGSFIYDLSTGRFR